VDRESLEALLARGLSVEEIGRRFGRHPSTVSYWMKKYGLEAQGRKKHAARGGIAYECLEALVVARNSISEIAAELGLSKATVRYWLRRYDMHTLPSKRVASSIAAKREGLATAVLVCRRHGEVEHALCGDGSYRCKRCRSESVARRRRRMKEVIVSEAGGQCCICGYDKYIGALEFHHLDRAEKRLTLSRNGVTLALETLRAEARKCVLVCSNCHAELEAGVVSLADKVVDRARGSTP
jgi:transposase